MTEYTILHKIFKRAGWEEVEDFSELHKIFINVALAFLLADTAVGAVVSGTEITRRYLPLSGSTWGWEIRLKCRACILPLYGISTSSASF